MSQSSPSGPRGWLALYLLLAILGGLLIFLLGVIYLIYHTGYSDWAFWISGLTLSATAVCAWRAFRRRQPSALSLARSCIIIFLLTVLFFTFSAGHDTILVTALLLLLTFGWSAIWWTYLSHSKQVKTLTANATGAAAPGTKIALGVGAVLLMAAVANYIHLLNYRHQIELQQLADRMHTEQLLAQMADEITDDPSRPAAADATPSQRPTPRPATATPRPQPAEPTEPTEAAPVVKPGYKTVETSRFTITVPDGYTHQQIVSNNIVTDEFKGDDLLGFQICTGLVDKRFTAYQIKNDNVVSLFDKYFGSNVMKIDRKTNLSPYQRGGNVILVTRYSSDTLDPVTFEALGIRIYNEQKDCGCYILSQWYPEIDPIITIANTLRFK